MSAVIDLINKFSGHSDSTNENKQLSNADNTSTDAGSPQAPITEESTTHTGTKAAEPQAPISAQSAPDESNESATDKGVKEDTKDEARDEQASKDGAPAHLIPDSEHYRASSNVQRILDEAEKAEEAHKPEEPVEGAGEVKNQETAPQKADKAKGATEEDKSAVPAPSNSDEPGETTTESGYKVSSNVQQIIDDAEKADEEHRPEQHAPNHDEEAKKVDNPTNASHTKSEEPAAGNTDQHKAEERPDDEPAQTTSKSGYTPSDNVKQILAKAEEADNANRSDAHDADVSHHKNLDEPTVNMSVHDNSKREADDAAN